MAIKIAVTGDLGSGKSTVCKELKKRLNAHYFSTGEIQRKIASEKGMSTYDLNRYAEDHPEIDRLIDDELKALSSSTDDMIIDSRMAWHFVNNAFKVFLLVDETVAAKRIIDDKRGLTETYLSIADAKQKLSARKESENFRYKQVYGVDCYDLTNYDLVIDTTDISPATVAERIIEQYTEWEKMTIRE